MTTAPIPANEKARLAALRELGLLDTEPDPSLDRITETAARCFGTPIALLCFVDEDRQWFKSRFGWGIQETSRDVAFCAHAIGSEQALVIKDATLDPRFADNPMVLGEPHVRFYAGQPLKGPDAQLIGTLCVIDSKPREFNDDERLILAVLGEAVERVLLVAWEREQQMVANRSAEALAELVDTTSFGVITTNDAGVIQEFNRGAEKIFGYTHAEAIGMQSVDLIPDATPGAVDAYFKPSREFEQEGDAKDRLLDGKRKNGERFPLALSISRFHQGGRYRYTGLVFDRSEITEAEADRSAFFGLSVDLFSIIDHDGRILRVNPAFLNVLGYSEEEL